MAITISDYVIGCVGFEITEAALASIFFNRGIIAGVDASSLTLRQRELAVADAYKWGATLPSGGKKVEDADAGWKHSETGYSITDADKAMWRKMANELYTKYGEGNISFGFTINAY